MKLVNAICAVTKTITSPAAWDAFAITALKLRISTRCRGAVGLIRTISTVVITIAIPAFWNTLATTHTLKLFRITRYTS